MKFAVIRVDGSGYIGMGHVSRQIDIALELKKRGVETIFIMKFFPQALSLLDDYDFRIIKLTTEDLSVNDSIKEMSSILSKIGKTIDYIIVDLLKFFDNQDYLNELKKFCAKLIIISDNTDPFYIKTDIVFALSQNQNPENYKNIGETKYYIGLKYFPLGLQFQNQGKKEIKKKVKKILITFGGTDSVNYSTRVAKFLRSFSFDGEITFIIGATFFKEHYEEFQKEIPEDIIVKRNIKNMIDYYKDTDLCICSAGNTLIELLTCGIPCIVLPQTIREEEHTLFYEKNKMVINLGLNWNEDALLVAINGLLKNYEKRRKMSVLSQEYFDGKGRTRMIDFILEEY